MAVETARPVLGAPELEAVWQPPLRSKPTVETHNAPHAPDAQHASPATKPEPAASPPASPADSDDVDMETDAEQQDALLEALFSAAGGRRCGFFPHTGADASVGAAVQLASSGKRRKSSHG